MATDVNASEFYLWSNTRDGVDWSISPAGLSSNGYDGHIFWDAETWMYPSLLAQHPDLAAGMDAYRFDGRKWLTVATVTGHANRTTDTLTFPKVVARFVRVRITKGTGISVTETINDKKQTVKADADASGADAHPLSAAAR
ncbi:MAG: hypothetical protein ACXVFO_01835 [Solirubrobacteraceae bacterium]